MRGNPLKAMLFHPAIRLLLLTAYCGFIFFLSSLSDIGPSHLPPGSDKVIHFFLYATLGFLALHFFNGVEGFPRRWVWIVAWGFSVAYGLSDEFHQSFVPHRTPSFWDLVFDALGSGAGIAFYRRAVGRFLDTP